MEICTQTKSVFTPHCCSLLGDANAACSSSCSWDYVLLADPMSESGHGPPLLSPESCFLVSSFYRQQCGAACATQSGVRTRLVSPASRSRVRESRLPTTIRLPGGGGAYTTERERERQREREQWPVLIDRMPPPQALPAIGPIRSALCKDLIQQKRGGGWHKALVVGSGSLWQKRGGGVPSHGGSNPIANKLRKNCRKNAGNCRTIAGNLCWRKQPSLAVREQHFWTPPATLC